MLYQVQFEEVVKGRKLDHGAICLQGIVCSDLERALALAGLLQKISTDLIQYENIIVEPFNTANYETEKK